MENRETAEELAKGLQDHLRLFFEASDLPPGRIAERLNLSEAQLQSVMAKSASELTLLDVLVVLHGLGVPPYRFFGDLGDSPITKVETRLMALEEELLEAGLLDRQRLDARTERCRFRGTE